MNRCDDTVEKLLLCSLRLIFFLVPENMKKDMTQPKHSEIFLFFFLPGGTLCAVLCDLESDQRRTPCLPPMRCSRIHQYHMCVPISGSTCHMPECAGVMLSVCQPSHCQPPRPSVFISRSPGVAAVRSHLQ